MNSQCFKILVSPGDFPAERIRIDIHKELSLRGDQTFDLLLHSLWDIGYFANNRVFL